MNSFEQILKEKKRQIEETIYPYIGREDGYNNPLVEAMKYSFEAGGKRLRPMIFLSVYEMISSSHSVDVGPYMAALEMIHTYSLIHDDLPAMDNDDLRRGKPTCHKVFGEAIAILAGDGLLNLSFEVLMDDIAKHPSINRINAAKTIIDAAGVGGMVGGQVVDILNDTGVITQELLSYIHQHKTGALIKAAFVGGGFLASADDTTILHLNNIGDAIGLAFQIQDDILDVIGNEDLLGKPLMSDAKNNKETFVTLNGLSESKRIMNQLLDEAIIGLDAISKSNSAFLKELVLYLSNRTY